MNRKRPFVLWVIILAQAAQVSTIAALYFAIYYTNIPIPPQILPNDAFLQLDTIVSTIMAFFTMIGLFRIKRWGWVLLMLRLGLDLITSIWGYISGTPNDLGMLTAVATVFYLNLRSVQALFLPQSEAA